MRITHSARSAHPLNTPNSNPTVVLSHCYCCWWCWWRWCWEVADRYPTRHSPQVSGPSQLCVSGTSRGMRDVDCLLQSSQSHRCPLPPNTIPDAKWRRWWRLDTARRRRRTTMQMLSPDFTPVMAGNGVGRLSSLLLQVLWGVPLECWMIAGAWIAKGDWWIQ